MKQEQVQRLLEVYRRMEVLAHRAAKACKDRDRTMVEFLSRRIDLLVDEKNRILSPKE